MLKKLLFITALILFAATAQPAQAEEKYSSIIEDLPLMDNMAEYIDDAVIFDKPSGRIIETSASFNQAVDEVYAFYDSALPPLGWEMKDKSTFIRDKEQLTVEIDGQRVYFKISPSPVGPDKP